ncbi:MAG: sugar phosphate nucleotidyltransferase, partial [Elusimicrobiota bacterium]
VLLLKDKISKPFLTMLGDEIYIQTRHNEMLKSFENYSENECDAMIGVFETENIEEVKKNYAVKIDSSNNVLDLEEKPQNPWNNLIGCGTYIFRPSVFNFIEKTPLSVRSGRKELADTMKLIVNSGRKIKAFSLGGNYVNINYREDFEKAEKLLRG